MGMTHKLILTSLTALVIAVTSSFAQDSHKSGPFQGAKANKGFVTHTIANGKSTLTLSDDFVPPQTPDPHWQIVDSNGKTYLLDRLMTKNQKVKKIDRCPRLRPRHHQGADVVRVCRDEPR